MKKLIPISFFYSMNVINYRGEIIGYCNGQINNDPSVKTWQQLLKIAKEGDSNADRVNVVALTPLEFEVVEK